MPDLKAAAAAPLESADVCIMGAGPVGGTLACRLAAAGVKTVVIDRAPLPPMEHPAFDGRAYAIAAGSRVLLRPDGVEVVLTGAEFDMLMVFLTHPQRVLNREQLLDWTRGRSAGPFDRTIDVQLSRLRRKLGDEPKSPAMIKTVRGGGYLFAPLVERHRT